MLSHTDIWRAIDRLAQEYGLSASGLARKAGLSPTLFNPSKRINGNRKRWPSTESVNAILRATGCSLESFVAMVSPEATQHSKIPILSCVKAAKKNVFNEGGLPEKKAWDEMPLPAATSPHAFALEISDKSAEPIFHEGNQIILDPSQTPRRGDWVALMLLNHEILIKKLGSSGAQKVDLLSSKQDEPPLTLGRKDITWLYRIIWSSI